MVKWKLQAVEPDTCEIDSNGRGCRYYEWWDAEANPLTRIHIIAAFERLCAAHTTDIPQGVMLGFDGNWKPTDEYIAYQRDYFKHVNHVEWLARGLKLSDMPAEIKSHAQEPKTTGSVDAPPPEHIAGLERAGEWNRSHNVRKNHTLDLAAKEHGNLNRDLVAVTWTGKGDSRVLHIHSSGQLTQSHQSRIVAATNIQFGNNSVVVEDQL